MTTDIMIPYEEGRSLTKQEIEQIKIRFTETCIPVFDEILSKIKIGQVEQIKIIYCLNIDKIYKQPEDCVEVINLIN
jgi:hypothetical protein